MAHEILHDEDCPIVPGTGAMIGTIIEIAGEELEVFVKVHPEGRLSLTITQLDPHDTVPGPAKRALLRSGLIEEQS